MRTIIKSTSIFLLWLVLLSPAMAFPVGLPSYGGGGGAGGGDMTKAVYDSGDDGAVDDLGCTDCVDATDLKDTDAPGDEECLTYEATGTTLEWQSCGSFTAIYDCTSGDCNSVNVQTGEDLTIDSGATLTISGAANAGGATDFEIPNGTGPTVNATGEIAIDTSDDQLIYYGGSSQRVLPYEFTKCAVIENLAAADDDFELFMANDAIVITSIGLHCAGTCTTGADISLEDRAGNAMTHTVPTHSTGTSATTFQSVTANNALTAGEALRMDVDNAVDPETDTYTICFTYTVTAQ